jgi:hypothetical protein
MIERNRRGGGAELKKKEILKILKKVLTPLVSSFPPSGMKTFFRIF